MTIQKRGLTLYLYVALVVAGVAGAALVKAQAPEPQTWSGVLSDSTCGAAHTGRATAGMTDRACAFHCIKELAKYVLVTDDGRVLPIANQDFAGLPLRLARPVRATGTLSDNAIMLSRLEPPVVHSHLGHVMIAWRDTPGTVGLLTVAISDARVAVAHAALTAKSETLDDLKLHAGHVLHALDPAAEPKGPASGYGVKRATAGAVQHLGFAVAAEGAREAVKSAAAGVSDALAQATTAADRAANLVAQIRASQSAAAAKRLAGDLAAEATRAAAELDRAREGMQAIMKAEGL